MPVKQGPSREPPLDEDENWLPWNEGFKAGKMAGVQNAADALARECTKAFENEDQDRANKFAEAQGCLLELFPHLER
jgi:hypothetical protein